MNLPFRLFFDIMNLVLYGKDTLPQSELVLLLHWLQLRKISSCLREDRRGIFWEIIWTDIVGRVILLDISVMTVEDTMKHETGKEKTVVRPTMRWNHTTYDSCWQHDITVLKLSTNLEYWKLQDHVCCVFLEILLGVMLSDNSQL